MSHGVLKGDHEVVWLEHERLELGDVVIQGGMVRVLVDDWGIRLGYRRFGVRRLEGDVVLGEHQFRVDGVSGSMVLRKVQTDCRDCSLPEEWVEGRCSEHAEGWQ